MIAAAVLLILLDLALTLWAVRRWGVGVELNPVWRRVMASGGPWLFTALFVMFWTGILGIAILSELLFIVLIGLVVDTALNTNAIRSLLRGGQA